MAKESTPAGALRERSDCGEVVPSPKFPTVESKKRPLTPALPKRMVEDAWSPPLAQTAMVVVGASVFAPKFCVTFQSLKAAEPTHTPLMEKQPPPRTMPLAKVDEAVEETMLRTSAWRPFAKVEVAVPATFRSPLMVVLPVLSTWKSVVVAKEAVEEPMRKSVVGEP
jgi:hypothetical protein